MSCHVITKKRWERLEQTKDYRKLTIVTEKLDSFFWLNSDFETFNKQRITQVLYQEWLRYSIGIQERLSDEEVHEYQQTLNTFPNAKEKLHQFRLAIQQALTHPSVSWGLNLLKTLQERGFLEVHPPSVKIVLLFRFDHEEARRLARILDTALRHRKRTSIHVCTRSKPPHYADLIITDHFSPLTYSKNQKTYFYHSSLGVEQLLKDVDEWISLK
nr:hypothetical protein [Enterococcus sp. MSG2901]